MRTTMHNGRAKGGRAYGSKHNDRQFDVQQADNIDVERMKDNQYINYYNDPNMTFEQVELKFYSENFGHQLAKTNERYVANGHPERCKSMEQWKAIRQNAPEESVLQIGKKEESASRKDLIAVYNDYNKWLSQWNREHGRPFTVLNTALHCDEAVNHIQSRRVWHYRDEDGQLRTGQEKALKAAGVELPDPEKEPGRRNNRKMTFDKMCREKWLDICHEHGLDVEREPVPDGKHNMEKEEMIRHKYETMLQEASEAEIRRDNAIGEAKAAEADLDVLKADILAEDKVLNDLVNEHNEKVAAFNDLVGKHNQLVEDTEQLEQEKNELMNIPGKVAFVDEIEIERPRFKKGKVLIDEKDLEDLKKAAKRDSALQYENQQQATQIRGMQERLNRQDRRMNELIEEKRNFEREVKVLQKELQPVQKFIKAAKLEPQLEKFLEEQQRVQQQIKRGVERTR